LKETAAAVKTAGAEPLIIAADLRQVAAADKVIKETVDKFGKPFPVNACKETAGKPGAIFHFFIS
jgi:hypothetical protein